MQFSLIQQWLRFVVFGRPVDQTFHSNRTWIGLKVHSGLSKAIQKCRTGQKKEILKYFWQNGPRIDIDTITMLSGWLLVPLTKYEHNYIFMINIYQQCGYNHIQNLRWYIVSYHNHDKASPIVKVLKVSDIKCTYACIKSWSKTKQYIYWHACSYCKQWVAWL